MDERISMLQDQIDGLQAALEKERTNEKIFHRAAGLEESAEKARAEVVELETDLEDLKEKLAEKQDAKNQALAATMTALSEKMSEILPEGGATFSITEDGLLIGWTKDKKFRPYHGLSGSELVQFQAALCNALMGDSREKILIMENAELDADNLEKTMDHLAGIDAQVIAMSCHAPKNTPDGWEIVTL